MTSLSVNINKVATIRNARGGNIPNVKQIAIDAQTYGANGITVHPRPDQRHITYQDVINIQPIITTEFNIEGYPSKEWLELVLQTQPHQATLVPDKPDAITSNAGWNTIKEANILRPIIETLQNKGIRVSIFIDAKPEMAEAAALLHADRIELYTGPYAQQYNLNKELAIQPYIDTATIAFQHNIGINAGHDLDLSNLSYFAKHIPHLQEVSIGHALISDALYYGLENTIQLYKRCL